MKRKFIELKHSSDDLKFVHAFWHQEKSKWKQFVDFTEYGYEQK